MMTVGGFATTQQAEARAPFYRSRGYQVAVREVRSRAGSIVSLVCTLPDEATMPTDATHH